MNLVGNREQYLEAAYSLRDTLMRMEATEQYWDDADHQTVQTAIMRLRPVMMAALGSTITFSPAAAPPRIWMPRLKDISRQCIAYLEANPDWPPEAQLPEPATWVHSRVWEHVSAHVQTALRSGHAKHWGTVASEAVRFLEDEIRARTGLTARDRRGLVGNAFNKTTGPLRLGDDENQAEAWREFVAGVLVGVGNPFAHGTPGVDQAYAMGVVGAVSLIVSAIDQRYPSATP